MVSHCRQETEGRGCWAEGKGCGETDIAEEACLINSYRSHERETGYAMGVGGMGWRKAGSWHGGLGS